MASQTLYKVVFVNQGQIYEVYARSVGQGALFGFIEIEELVFGERSHRGARSVRGEDQVGIQGGQAYLPADAFAIIRIDEVDKQGTSKISKVEGSNVAQFPSVPVYTPGEGNNS